MLTNNTIFVLAIAGEDMGFLDGWGTVATQLEAYATGLMK